MPSVAELTQPTVDIKTKSLADTVKTTVPLWNTGAPIAGKAPRSKQVPAIWSYADTKSLLLSAAKLVDPRQAERRAVLFINPGKKESPFTLDTLLAAHQLILPGEKAVCHRHTPFAVRFLIEGEQGYTAISGKKMYMEPGDLIITPSWNWHDHGNEGNKNVIWLDGLNIPIFQPNPIDFTEHYTEEFGKDTHESATCTDEEASEMKFAWAEMKKRLDAVPGSYAQLEYTLPSGASVSTTIGAFMERINAGAASTRRKETTNHIFQVHRGYGTTEITSSDGEVKETIEWGPGDAFAIPSWHEFTNQAKSEEQAYLFYFSDKPMLQNLGFWKTS
ncbi:RmlC-like cupin [Thozetella sp. PMI_491]|nr:RmlC-like cupin [Thozetella sp. PMI_491]